VCHLSEKKKNNTQQHTDSPTHTHTYTLTFLSLRGGKKNNVSLSTAEGKKNSLFVAVYYRKCTRILIYECNTQQHTDFFFLALSFREHSPSMGRKKEEGGKNKCVCAFSMGRGIFKSERNMSVYVPSVLREIFKSERDGCVRAPSLGEKYIRVRER